MSRHLLACTFAVLVAGAPAWLAPDRLELITPARAAAAPCPYPLTGANRPVAPASAPSDTATFVDPTVETQSAEFVTVGRKVYLGPFARLEAQSASHGICIEDSANVQDNTLVKVNGGPATIGEEAIIAHGGQMVGDGTAISLAHHGACPLPDASIDPATGARPDPNVWATAAERGRQALANALADAGHPDADCDRIPAFIGFNSLNHSHIEDGALLGAMSRLSKGVVLRAGYSTFPGKSVDTQVEADTPCGDPAACDVRYITAGDVAFMFAVVHVNECFAKGYTRQYRQEPPAHPAGGPDSIRGVGIDPGSYHKCEFNDDSERPTIGYEDDANLDVRDPSLAVSDPNPPKKVRIIGDVRMVGNRHRPEWAERLDDVGTKIQDNLAIRADEGEPMTFRGGIEFGFANTFHALEPTPEDPEREIRVGSSPPGEAPVRFSGIKFEERVITHGGGRRVRSGPGAPDPEPTIIERFAFLGKDAVIFRSHVAERTHVGSRAVLAGYDNGCDPDGNCTPGEVIPDRCVKLSDTPPNTCAYFVEW